MYWQEDDAESQQPLTDNVVDVLFSLDCRSIAVDHLQTLSTALTEVAPWLEAQDCGIHSIHVAGSQNGWERPAHGSGQQLHLSRRTKLCIRVPEARVGELCEALQGRQLDLAGTHLGIRQAKVKRLGREPTLFARYVAGPEGDDEARFLQWAAEELAAMDIRIRKALCGKSTPIQTDQGPIETRSLMLADLKPEESVRLQQHGLGPLRHMGCGLFLPHKGIDAVHKPAKEE